MKYYKYTLVLNTRTIDYYIRSVDYETIRIVTRDSIPSISTIDNDPTIFDYLDGRTAFHKEVISEYDYNLIKMKLL